METGKYCAYNVTRNALLSERVTVAPAALGSLETLGLATHGPGADQESAVWLRGLSGPPKLPNLIAVDILYLDESHRVIVSSSIGPGADFPPPSDPVTSALILPDRRLAETGTGAGDQLRFCMQADLPAIVKATTDSPFKGQEPLAIAREADRIPAGVMRYEVIRPAAYVFEPFVGSLMYIPEVAEPQPLATEYFLPQLAPPAATEVPVGIAVSAEAVAEVAPSPQSETTIEPIEESPPEVRIKRRAKKPSTSEKEPPRFYRPKAIRFFDPASASETEKADESTDQPIVPEPATPRFSNELSPELKAAFLEIDALQHRKQTSKSAGLKEARSAKRKSVEKPAVEAVSKVREPMEPIEEVPTARMNVIEGPVPYAPTSSDPVELQPSESIQASEAHIEPSVSPESAVTPQIEQPPANQHLESPAPEIEPPSNLQRVAATVQEQETPPAAEPEPSEPLSALAEENAEIELIEASLTAMSEATPEIDVPIELGAETIKAAPHAGAPAESRPVIPEPPPELELPSEPLDHNAQAIRAAATPIGERLLYPPLYPEPREITQPQESKPGKKAAKQKPSLAARFQRWLGGNLDGKRRGERVQMPGLVAFYWSGGAPRPHEIVNISKSGFYLRTRELWTPNTLVRMTLQKSDVDPSRPNQSISILARVVRTDDKGVGHEFVTREDLLAIRSRDILPENGTDRKLLESFLDLE